MSVSVYVSVCAHHKFELQHEEATEIMKVCKDEN